MRMILSETFATEKSEGECAERSKTSKRKLLETQTVKLPIHVPFTLSRPTTLKNLPDSTVMPPRRECAHENNCIKKSAPSFHLIMKTKNKVQRINTPLGVCHQKIDRVWQKYERILSSIEIMICMKSDKGKKELLTRAQKSETWLWKTLKRKIDWRILADKILDIIAEKKLKIPKKLNS